MRTWFLILVVAGLASCKRGQLGDAPPPGFQVVIRAQNGPFVPIKHLGQTVGRTDESGTATFLANVKPNDNLEFTLNTSADDAFKRHSPIDPTVQYLVQP